MNTRAHISKLAHVQRSIFDELCNVLKCGVKLSLVFDTSPASVAIGPQQEASQRVFLDICDNETRKV